MCDDRWYDINVSQSRGFREFFHENSWCVYLSTCPIPTPLGLPRLYPGNQRADQDPVTSNPNGTSTCCHMLTTRHIWLELFRAGWQKSNFLSLVSSSLVGLLPPMAAAETFFTQPKVLVWLNSHHGQLLGPQLTVVAPTNQ